MPGEVEEARSEGDERDVASRANLRDYPSTALVLLALAGSSAAWMLYKWLGGKPKSRGDAAKGREEAKGPVQQRPSSDEESS